MGVYVDGFNVYFGGRTLCGAGTPGWRWLDLRALAETLVAQRMNWEDAHLERVIYCTALISGRDNAGGRRDQDTYVRALRETGSVDTSSWGTTCRV